MTLSAMIQTLERDYRDADLDLARTDIELTEPRPQRRVEALGILDVLQRSHHVLDRWDDRLVAMEIYMSKLEPEQ